MCFLLGFWFEAFRLSSCVGETLRTEHGFARVLMDACGLLRVARRREIVKFGVMVFSLLLLLLLFLTVSRFLLSCAMLFTF
jgi:hypothetical protein